MTSTDVDSRSQKDPLAAALQWDIGTAYDLIFSIRSIFNPKEFGLPAPWAAGVRKRLSPTGQREMKDFFSPPFAALTYLPIQLVLEMEAPKTVARFLEHVETLPGHDFMKRLHVPMTSASGTEEIAERALNGATMTEEDVEEYRRAVGRSFVAVTPSTVQVRRLFDDMADPEAARKRWLSAVREYQAVFFAEEEQRLQPVLERTLSNAQKLAKTATVPDLLEQLSNGFTISEDINLERLVLTPSVWCHPFVVRMELPGHGLFVAWGAHPPGYRLVPGESVPEDALLVLRALADPTRLRLLRLIVAEPRSLQSLAHEVKLTLPTVSHHIRELRGAGLIRLEVGGSGRESKYTVRWPSAERAFQQLEQFVLNAREE